MFACGYFHHRAKMKTLRLEDRPIRSQRERSLIILLRFIWTHDDLYSVSIEGLALELLSVRDTIRNIFI